MGLPSDFPSFDEFYSQLLWNGKAVYGSVEYRIAYDPDPRPRCNICQNLVQDHAPVIMLLEGKAIFRLCNGALVCPDNFVLDGANDTFFFEGTPWQH